MSFNIDSNLRLELGRQRQAELQQQAQRDKLEHALSAEIASDAGLLHTGRDRSCPCVATARHFQGRRDDHRARAPGGVALAEAQTRRRGRPQALRGGSGVYRALTQAS